MLNLTFSLIKALLTAVTFFVLWLSEVMLCIIGVFLLALNIRAGRTILHYIIFYDGVESWDSRSKRRSKAYQAEKKRKAMAKKVRANQNRVKGYNVLNTV